MLYSSRDDQLCRVNRSADVTPVASGIPPRDLCAVVTPTLLAPSHSPCPLIHLSVVDAFIWAETTSTTSNIIIASATQSSTPLLPHRRRVVASAAPVTIAASASSSFLLRLFLFWYTLLWIRFTFLWIVDCGYSTLAAFLLPFGLVRRCVLCLSPLLSSSSLFPLSSLSDPPESVFSLSASSCATSVCAGGRQAAGASGVEQSRVGE